MTEESDTKVSAPSAGSTSTYQSSWEPSIAKRIADQVSSDPSQQSSATTTPYIVGLVGIPGGGKSVSSLLLADQLQQSYGIACTIMPHDGYHYSMEQLRLFPDPQDVIYRRGAPDTFDPHSLLRDLKRIRFGSEPRVSVPGFDHGKGDPEPNAHTFNRSLHQVVLCEGLYLLHDADGWEPISELLDFKIFIESDVDACIERLKVRNLAIPGYTAEEIRIRVEEVDRANAMTVIQSQSRADVVVQSIVSSPTNTEASSLMHRRVSSIDALNLMNVEVNGADATVAAKIPEGELHLQPATPINTAMIGTWECDMAKQIADRMKRSSRRPYMVGIVGMPGSGKSVSALLLASELEHLLRTEVGGKEEEGESHMRCCIIPHDGYHYTMKQLRSFCNADSLIYRRGAPDTFDPLALTRDLDRIREGEEARVLVPGFDHSIGDPEPGKHVFDRQRHDICICEGLYLLHEDENDEENGWSKVKNRLDFSIFMNSDLETCMERVQIRNQCIPGYSPGEITERVQKVDRVNAMTVLRGKGRADAVVESLASLP